MDDDYETISHSATDVANEQVSSTGASTKTRKVKKASTSSVAAEAPIPNKKNIPEVEEVVVRINEFDLNSIPPHKPSDSSGVKIVIIGKAGTGKSTLIQALLASKAHLAPVIQVFNGTEDSNGSYSQRCPPCFVFDKLDLNAMIAFKSRQTLAGRNIPENPWAIQVIDDCTDDPKVLKHPVVQAYYKNGRHWHMIHVLSLQYSMDIPPNIRSNIDYTFILRESNKKNRKRLYENYCASAVESLADFEALMDALTENYMALVICNRTASNKLEDCVFYFKADPNAISPAWRFGHATCWEFNEERFDENYVEPLIKA